MEIEPEPRTFFSEERIFPAILIAVIVLVAIGGGIVYWYYNLPNQDFVQVYASLGIRQLPASVERQFAVYNRLDQLKREACYQEAVLGLAEALLDAGYPRESATSLRSFAKRCGRAEEVLPLAYQGLERVSDFSGAVAIAMERCPIRSKNREPAAIV